MTWGTTWRTGTLTGTHTHTGPVASGHNGALSRPPRGQLFQRTGLAGSIRNRSGSCCADASDSRFRSVRAPAGVAASWPSMAIIEQRVHKQGFWIAEGSLLECAHARLDSRRLGVVADGLTLWRGAQLAIDTTLVSPSSRMGQLAPERAPPTEPRLRKERTYPELAGEGGGARLVLLAAEVGRRWSDEIA